MDYRAVAKVFIEKGYMEPLDTDKGKRSGRGRRFLVIWKTLAKEPAYRDWGQVWFDAWSFSTFARFSNRG